MIELKSTRPYIRKLLACSRRWGNYFSRCAIGHEIYYVILLKLLLFILKDSVYLLMECVMTLVKLIIMFFFLELFQELWIEKFAR